MASSDAVTVTWATSDGTAEAGKDYTAVTNGSITFSPGNLTQAITVTIADDDVDEDNETFTVTLSNAVNATLAGGQATLEATGTITDDDERGVTVNPTSLTVDEGSSKPYTVVLKSEPTGAVTVAVAKASGSDADVTVSPTDLTFTADNWSTEQTVTVSAAQDADAAADMATVEHTVSGGDYGANSVTAQTVAVTVNDDETVSTSVTLSVSPGSVGEAAGATTVTVTAMLNAGARTVATTVTVSIGDASDSATSGTDYTSVNDFTVTIAAEQTSGTGTFTLTPVSDDVDENNETVSVGGTVTGLTVTADEVTITDDDERGVTVSPTSLTVAEGGSKTYTVVLDSEPTAAVTVSITASGDSDISVQQSSLTFTAGDWNMAQTVTVDAAADVDAAHGTATIAHGVTSGGDYAGVTASSVTVTERDTNSQSTTVTLRVSPSSVSESGSATVTVTGTLNGGTRSDATTVTVTVAGNSASNSDFAAVSNFTLTISANQASGNATFTLSPVNDGIDENNETVEVSGTTTANGLTVTGTEVTITDDDTRGVTVDPASLTVNEGESKTYTVVLDSEPTAAVTVSITASGDSDISAQQSSLTFTADNWNTAQTVTVDAAIDGDAAHGTATIAHGVTSSGDYAGVTASDVTVTERDTESTTVTLSINDASVAEDAGSVTFTVSLSTVSSQTVVVGWEILNGTATAGEDYTAVMTGSVTFNPGEALSQTISVTILDDEVDEADETFEVRLINVQNAILVGGESTFSATGTIVDNDDPPVVSAVLIRVMPASQIESGGKMVFGVRLSKASVQTVTTECKTLNGTAMAGEDYVEGVGTLTIPPGEMNGRIEVVLMDDDVEESDETFMMVLGNVVNAELAEDGQVATGTILDDDEPEPEVIVSFEQSHYTVSEGGNAVQIRVHLSETFDHRVELSLSAVHGNGATKADYSGVPEKVIFEPYEDVKTFEVMAIDDDDDDDDETVTLDFGTVPDEISTGGSAIIEIIDNDDPVVTVSYGKEKYEIPEGGSAYLLSVHLNTAPLRRVEIPLVAVPGNGATEADYSPVPKRIIFLPHQVEKMFEVRAFEDDEDDDGETVALSFGTLPDRVNQGSLSTLCIIDNDDPEVKVSFGERKYEIIEGGPAVQVLVHLSADPERRVKVPLLMTHRNGATAGDYSGVPEQVIFDSGETEKTFAVMATDDDEIEDDESVAIRFGRVSDQVNRGSLSILRIIDNDNPDVTVSYGQASYETVEGGSAVQVTVRLSADPRRRVVIPLLAEPDNGATEVDYSGVPEHVIFDSGETEKTFDVLATDDDVDDDGEMVRLSFGALPDRVNEGGSASVSLVDNDERGVTVVPEQLRVPEGGRATYTVVLTSEPTEDVTVDVSVPSGTDVSVDKTSLTFTPLTYNTAQTIAVSAADDDDAMADDAVALMHAVSGGDYATEDASDVIVRISEINTPGLLIYDVMAMEDSGEMLFTVRLNMASSKVVTVVCAISEGTAKKNEDYIDQTGRLEIKPGETEGTIRVPILDDALDEVDETFIMVLSDAENATVVDGEAVGTIIDDDLPLVSIAADVATVVEGESAMFGLTRVGDVTGSLSVSVRVSQEGAFFSGTPPTTVMFEAGSAVAMLVVATDDDDLDEPDGAVRVAIAEGEAYALSESASATVLIADNDDAPDMMIGDVRGSESDGDMVFTVTLGAVSGREVMVDWATEDGTAKAGEDYEGMSGRLRFEAMAVAQTVRVVVLDDALDEVDETFGVVLSNAVNATVRDGEAVGTIADNDLPLVSIAADATTVVEGESAMFRLTRVGDLTVPLSVSVQVSQEGAFFSGTPPTTVMFEAGLAVATLVVATQDDDLDEPDGAVRVAIAESDDVCAV